MDDPALDQAVVLGARPREPDGILVVLAAGRRVGQGRAVHLEDEEAALGQHAADLLEALLHQARRVRDGALAGVRDGRAGRLVLGGAECCAVEISGCVDVRVLHLRKLGDAQVRVIKVEGEATASR